MKKQVLKIFSMLMFAVTLSVAAVNAKPVEPLRGKIPFDFSVGNKTLPAGVYTITSLTTPGVILIRREDSRASAMIITFGVNASRVQDQTKLVFRRYGAQYFLSQVWTAGVNNGRELQKSRTERDLLKKKSNVVAMKAVEPEMVVIVMQ
jgi:hypothetical protein